MGEDAAKFVKIRLRDPNAARYYESGIAVLPANQAEAEVMAGKADYVTKESSSPSRTVAASAGQKQVAPSLVATDYMKRVSFGRGFTKVAWVQDFSRIGGAELSCFRVVEVGRECGFDIVGIGPQDVKKNILDTADLIVINNFFQFSQENFDIIRKYLFEHRVPYVKYEHDHRELRRENISRALFNASILNVFISPKHKADHDHILDTDRNVELPLAVDPSMFPYKEGLDDGVVLLPVPRKYGKSLEQYVMTYPKLKYLAVGPLKSRLPVPVEILQQVEAKKMSDYYHRAGRVVHFPEDRWAGERVVFEAVLCGCRVETNENSGHMSWEWFGTASETELRERLAQAPYQFWSVVDGVTSN